MNIVDRIVPLIAGGSTQAILQPRWLRRALAIAVLICILLGIWWASGSQWFSLDHVLALLDAYPLMAPALFVGIYAIFVMLMAPALALNFAAGFLFGTVQGAALSTAGGTLGCIASLLIARHGLASAIGRRLGGGRMGKFEEHIARRGWLFVAIVRLNPIVPTGPSNYLFGLTTIPLWTYTWSTLTFLFPPALAFAGLGKAAGGALLTPEASARLHLIYLGSGAFSLLCMLVIIGFWIKRRLQSPL